ncbi:MAG: adenylate/guanylate cyclase domain-containing protein [Pseudomonadota bacterium]
MKRHALLIGLGLLLVIAFLGSAAKLYRIGFIQQLDNILYDYRLKLTMPGGVDKRIAILDIDEKSLKEEGRWPWSRDRLATLIDQLFNHYGVAVAGFDVVFAEKDESSGFKVLQALGRNQLKDVPQFQSALLRLGPQLDYDSLFAGKIKDQNVVLGYYFSSSSPGGEKQTSGALPEPVFASGTFQGRPIDFEHRDGYGGNLQVLQSSAAGAGHFNPMLDPDGVVRRVPMLVEYNGAYYESLSLAMVRTLFGATRLAPGFVGSKGDLYGGLEWLDLASAQGNLRIPVDENVGTLVPYRGGQGSFPYFSLADVLHERVPLAQLKGKIVLIGTSAPGLNDMRSTPVAEAYPGVEVHANLIAGMLDRNLKQKPPYVMAVEVALLLIIGVTLSLLLPMLTPVKATLLTLGTLAAAIIGNVAMWHYAGLALPLASIVLLVLMLFAVDMPYGYFIAARTKRQITNLFGQYVPSELVDEMSRNPEQVSMESASREMTILFSDVRGFTTISEGLDARELALLMNEFLTPLSRVVYKHRGTIDKYMGDCIMAFWGAPLPDTQHAHHAILAALEMQQALEQIQPRFRERGWPEIHIGVGLNTGKVSVGNMGSEVRVAYTVMGDAVNLASRLESITKQYGVGVMVGENTKNAAPEFVYRELDQVRVKGKDEPVTIYEPIGLQGQVAPAVVEEIKLFQQVVRLYRRQDWDQAELQLYNLQRNYPASKLYQVYAERIAYFREHPPGADWDGVFVFQTK